jgi:hypothetical protein
MGGWSLSLLCMFSLVYGLLHVQLGTVSSAAYASLGHTAWGMGLAWIVVACCTGHGGEWRKWDTIFDLVAMLRAGRPRNRGSIPGRGNILSSLWNIKNGSGAQTQPLIEWVPGGSFPWSLKVMPGSWQLTSICIPRPCFTPFGFNAFCQFTALLNLCSPVFGLTLLIHFICTCLKLFFLWKHCF